MIVSVHRWADRILRPCCGWQLFARVDRFNAIHFGGPGKVYEKPHRFADGSEVIGPKRELEINYMEGV